ncbi:MAG: hypothetical protein ACD_60C00038G0005 [uncultured bacterium]|nr:MAG: hypothetical protein ACD_60C00038G0005 [uncultured bacterium]
MITLRNLTLRRGTRVLLSDVNWTIYLKQRIGIIGANGSGKSSLFALLLSQLSADEGEIEIPRQLTLAHVAQETPGYNQSALQFVLAGDTRLQALEEALSHAEKEQDGMRIAELHQQLSEADAYTAKSRAAEMLAGLGFSEAEQQQPVSYFSGGFRVRLNLARALMCRSDVLLLDEPTNHLDLDAVIWLEQWLMKYPGTLLLISHDREFLDHVVGHIAHLSEQRLDLYTGNYSTFEKTRAEQILLQQAAFEKQQKQIAHMQQFVNRFRAKASKARQAQSRLKAIERLELVNAVQMNSPFQFHFKEPSRCANPLIRLDEASIAYENKVILQNVNFSIGPKDRIGILGPNGAGKSSLIKLLAGDLIPASGVCERSAGLKIGYFAQHQVDQLLLPETALYHLCQIAPNVYDKELRTYLGTFGFIGDRVHEPVECFSGGEKSRLALALLIWKRPHLLLLDEPTNHLDLEMRQALSIALQEYAGAMLLVSHDRFLIRTSVDQLMLVSEGSVNNFDGDLEDYEQWLREFRRPKKEESLKSELSKKTQRQINAKERENKKLLLQRIKNLEDELLRLQKENDTIDAALTDTALYEPQNKERLQSYLLSKATLQKELQCTEDAWLQVCEERNRL